MHRINAIVDGILNRYQLPEEMRESLRRELVDAIVDAFKNSGDVVQERLGVVQDTLTRARRDIDGEFYSDRSKD